MFFSHYGASPRTLSSFQFGTLQTGHTSHRASLMELKPQIVQTGSSVFSKMASPFFRYLVRMNFRIPVTLALQTRACRAPRSLAPDAVVVAFEKPSSRSYSMREMSLSNSGYSAGAAVDPKYSASSVTKAAAWACTVFHSPVPNSHTAYLPPGASSPHVLRCCQYRFRVHSYFGEMQLLLLVS